MVLRSSVFGFDIQFGIVFLGQCMPRIFLRCQMQELQRYQAPDAHLQDMGASTG